MNNNDILRRLRFTFDFSDKAAVALFTADPASTAELELKDFKARLLKEEEVGFVPCSDLELGAFLDGLIVSKRGLREPAPEAQAKPADFRLSKNDILKKLRIAMNFREAQMLEVLKSGGSELSKSELGALFRNPSHKHFRPCGNQVLRNFIKGLTESLRSEDNKGSVS
jgi:uncharacterized protein YehS (DUF1456 family)